MAGEGEGGEGEGGEGEGEGEKARVRSAPFGSDNESHLIFVIFVCFLSFVNSRLDCVCCVSLQD